jgi:O-antigen ligase
LALAVCIVWWYLGRRLRFVAGIAMLGGTTLAITLLPSTIQTIGPFNSRSGSDSLRGEILEQSIKLAQANFWLGGGPSTTVVSVYDNFSFFVHNSFLGVISEGGIVSAAAVVTLIVLTFGRMITLPAGLRNPWFEMSLLAILICALHLGEVLLDLPAALAIGFGLSWLARPEPGSPQPIPPMNRAMGRTNRLNTPNVTGVL